MSPPLPLEPTLPILPAIFNAAEFKAYSLAGHAIHVASLSKAAPIVSSHRFKTHDMPVDVLAPTPAPVTIPETSQQRLKRKKLEKQRAARMEKREREEKVKMERRIAAMKAPVVRKDRWGKKSQEELAARGNIRSMQKKLMEREARRLELREGSESSSGMSV